jgi:hypothetical protein
MDLLCVAFDLISFSLNLSKVPEANRSALKTRDYAFQESYRDCQKWVQLLQGVQSACAMVKDLE